VEENELHEPRNLFEEFSIHGVRLKEFSEQPNQVDLGQDDLLPLAIKYYECAGGILSHDVPEQPEYRAQVRFVFVSYYFLNEADQRVLRIQDCRGYVQVVTDV
jgi:hypothetical protein